MFKHDFGFAQHLTCFLHVRRNVKDKLREYNMSKELTTEILGDVFGNKLGSVYMEGLVDAKNPDDLQAKLDKVTAKWKCLGGTDQKVEQFVSWFVAYKVPVISESMFSQVGEECGLGSPRVRLQIQC